METLKTEKKPKIENKIIPLPGNSYVSGDFFYCVYGTEVKWEDKKVITTGVLVREVRTGKQATIPIEKWEEWEKGKLRTDL